MGAVVDRPRRVCGKQVEISIAYASDWSVQGLGAFVDDVTLSTGKTTSFERPRRLGRDRPAARQLAEREQLDARDRGRLPRGGRRGDPDTLYMGFGIEGIATPEARSTVLRRSLEYLLR